MIIEKHLTRETLLESALIADSLITSTTKTLEKQNITENNITHIIKLFIKLDGTDTSLDLEFDTITNLQSIFSQTYFRLFGFKPVSKKLVIESVFVEAIGGTDIDLKNKAIKTPNASRRIIEITSRKDIDRISMKKAIEAFKIK